MPIDIVIQVHDDAAAQKIKNFANTVEKESGRATSKMEGFFKRASSSIISSTSSMGGSVTSVLAGIGGKAGVAGLAITAIGASMGALASKAAKAGQEIEAIKFSATLDVIGKKTDEIIFSLGSKLLPLFNGMFEFLGLAASTAEVSAAQIKQQNAEQTKLLKLSTDIGSLSNDISETLKQITDKRKDEVKLIDEANKKQEAFTAKLFDTNQAFAEARALLERIDAGETLFPLTTKQIQEANKEANGFLNTLYTIDDAEADAARAEFLGMFEEKGSRGIEITQQLTQQFINLTGVLYNLRTSGMDWFDQLLSVGANVFANILTGGTSGLLGGVFGFANGGIIGAASGMIVRRPTMLMTGEGSKPEAIVPLSADKRPQRDAVMQAAGLGGNSGGIIVNINNVQHVDPVTVRNLLLPEINRQIRRGEKLLASQLR